MRTGSRALRRCRAAILLSRAGREEKGDEREKAERKERVAANPLDRLMDIDSSSSDAV
jgi:hypothetical protein